MKSIAKYIPLLGLALALGACQDDFDNKIPAFEEPVAENLDKVNTKILELKEMYWHEGTADTDLNYVDTVGYVYNDIDDITGTTALYPRNADGSRKKLDKDIYIKGRVISNDQDGNIFKSLIIQDESAAIAFSINQYDLYLQYRPGQEIVINATGMYIGKYRGLLQFGLPSFNENKGYYETSFMPIEFFRMHAERNGFPEPSKIKVYEFDNFDTFSSTANPEVLKKYQSQLVRFNNVMFKNADGKTVFSAYKSSGTDQPLVDSNSAANIIVRTSGYSTFWNNPLPEGRGDVEGILSYYASNSSNATFQMLLNSLAGCMNFGNPTVPAGQTPENPLTIDQVIEKENAGVTGTGWVTGYIVGAVGPEVEGTITANSDIEWTADVTLANTIVIAPAAEIADIASCLVVALPQGSALRQYANLVDNPANYKKQIWIKGTFDKYMGAWGLSTAGAAGTFKIDGVETPDVPDVPTTGGEGTEASPWTVPQLFTLYNGATGETGWVEGYIVGTVTDKSYDSAVFSADNASNTNILLAATPSETNAANCVPVQLPAGDVRNAVSLQQHPENLGKKVFLQGTIDKYFGVCGLKTTTAYKWADGTPDTPDQPDQPDTPSGDGNGTEASPWNVAAVMGQYNGATGATGWMECYIVGTVTDKSYDSATFSTDNASNTNILVAASASETNPANCLPVQLPAGDVRNALSLQQHPDNLGKKVILNGTIDKYFGVCGFKTVTAYKWADGSTTTPDTPDQPDQPDQPSVDGGTEASPWNVGNIQALYNAGSTGTAGWVEGYIVGSVPTQYYSDAAFTAEGASNTNLLLAASASETDAANCIPVQLPAGDVRNALSLQQHPDNLGKKVKLNGSVEKYFGVAGFKTVTAYQWSE